MIRKIYLSFFRVKNRIYDVIDLVNNIKIYIHHYVLKMFIYIVLCSKQLYKFLNLKFVY